MADILGPGGGGRGDDGEDRFGILVRYSKRQTAAVIVVGVVPVGPGAVSAHLYSYYID